MLMTATTFGVAANDAGSCQIDTLIDCNADMPKSTMKTGWQFGVGVASAVNVPVYIGAKETHSAILPLPYITYRSPNLTIGQGGIVAQLFDSKKWMLSVSLSGAIPVESDDAAIRKGMPDVDAIFEFGPSLKYYLLGDDDSQNAAFIDLNVRQASTIKFQNLDLTSSPAIVARYQLPNTWFGGRVNARISLGYEFVSASYADLFYSVAKRFETNERIAYQAPGGYGGYRINGGLRWQQGQHIVSSFIALVDISSAKYVDSPLIKTTQHLYGGMVYFYLFE